MPNEEQTTFIGSLRRIFNSGTTVAFVRRRLPVMAAVLAIEAGLLFAFSSLSLPQDQLQSYSKYWNQTATSISSLSPAFQVFAILENNAYLAWGMFTPVVGQISFMASSYNTARVLDVIAAQSNTTSSDIVLRLYLLPHTWIETFAYAVAFGEGVCLLWALVGGRRRGAAIEWVERELPYVILSLAATSVLLVLAAIFEVGEGLVGSGGDPVLALLSWIPFAVLLGAAAIPILRMFHPSRSLA